MRSDSAEVYELCGIAGCALQSGKASEFLYGALKRLEYRGYDSVGQATIKDGVLHVKKDRGKIEEVQAALLLSDMEGSVGIGHTRWATHGAPSTENAHPHTDCKGAVAIVHNGIIENFMELRQELESKGHRFRSRTDSEVVAHIVEDQLGSGLELSEAARRAARRLAGAYALAIVSTSEPETIVCVRKESPLVIGLGSGGNYCASDIPAFLPLTNRAVILEDGEMATLTPRQVKLASIESGEEIFRDAMHIDWTPEAAVKHGFPHFMLKEIHEQPLSVRNALRTQAIYLDLMASLLNKAERIFLVACGTSYHACMAGSYALAQLAHVNAQPVIASEFADHFGPLLDSKCVVLAVSQSGETADTLGAVRAAKERGAKILSITNVMGSTLTRLSDVYIGQNSGPEVGVAATKTFTAQVAVLTRLAIALSQKRGTLHPDEATQLNAALSKVPDQIRDVLHMQEERVKLLVEKYSDRRSFCFLGRGVSVATALEGRLKLLELSYMPSIAYPAGESKHGFISVVEEGYPVVFVAPNDETHSKVIGNVMEMKARGGSIIALIDEKDGDIKQLADHYIELPSPIPHVLTSLVYVIPLQLLAYYLSVKKGNNPDFPRNLAKSVTVQ